ncbi:Arm DNA-binding domain-containing protein [Pseudomonas sp. DWP3-1-2]|uniref:Arm DNA-binding domain-containing protein n=1 Tax=Pseudomonas sp. DWP3-1-2 TaxID=2804645 RepID=UPI003CF6986B
MKLVSCRKKRPSGRFFSLWRRKPPPVTHFKVHISLGMYPAIGLKEARLPRDQARALVAQGIDPRGWSQC